MADSRPRFWLTARGTVAKDGIWHILLLITGCLSLFGSSRRFNRVTPTTGAPTNMHTVEQSNEFAAASPLKSSPAHSSATSHRRLEDADVRSIFEALHHNKPAPAHLPFSIVRVGPTGLKLSPPSYEFQDGLYVLLRPAKKNKKKQGDQLDVPQPPPHLKHLLMKVDLPENCPWSLSGPQFPVPTAIQQRYCYPKGRPEYSSRQGGALWTMYGADGKEDVQYRLLHVYFSAKRAINKGMSGFPDGSPTQLSALRSPPRKRPSKRRSTPPRRALPKRKVVPQQNHQPNELYHSPAITTSSVTSSSLCNSPLSFEHFPHLSFPEVPTNGSRGRDDRNEADWPEQFIVTPINDIVEVPQSSRTHPPPSAERQFLHQSYFSEDNQGMPGGPLPSPFRAQINTPASTINVQKSPLFRTGEYSVEMPCDDTSISSSDPFHLEFPLKDEIDAFWDDPLTTIMLKPSQDFGTDSSQNDDAEYRHSPAHMFALRLETLQDSIRDRILSAPVSEQPKLVNVMATWARKMAIDPLALPTGQANGSGAALQQNGARLKNDTEISSTVGV